MFKFMQGLYLKDYFFIGLLEFFEVDYEWLGKCFVWVEIFLLFCFNDNCCFWKVLFEVDEEVFCQLQAFNVEDMVLYDWVKIYCLVF